MLPLDGTHTRSETREAAGDDGVGGLRALRVPGDRAQELVAIERVQVDVVLRRDRRRARDVAQQRDLPDMVTGAER